jgi:preprotein translocase subunit SecG
MSTILVVIHIIACIALIGVVLLQSGKGASLGAAFGGSSQTIFGATGGADFFEKLTTGIAIVFMLTSISLTYIGSKRGEETIMKPKAAAEQKVDSKTTPTSAPEAGKVPKTNSK